MIKVMMTEDTHGLDMSQVDSLKECDWQLVTERNTYKAALENIVRLCNNGDLDVENCWLRVVVPKIEGTTIDTPELDKSMKNYESQVKIVDFIVWLYSEKHITLSKPKNLPIQKLVAEYFGFDLEKLNNEKRKLLAFAKEDKNG